MFFTKGETTARITHIEASAEVVVEVSKRIIVSNEPYHSLGCQAPFISFYN